MDACWLWLATVRASMLSTTCTWYKKFIRSNASLFGIRLDGFDMAETTATKNKLKFNQPKISFKFNLKFYGVVQTGR